MKPTLYLGIAMSVAAVSCSAASGTPKPDDIPAIMAEARGETSPPRRESPARRAVRLSFLTMSYVDSVHEAGVKQRFQTPQLRYYLMLPESHVGGSFPAHIARLLREVEQLNRDYLTTQESYPQILADRLDKVDLPEAERRRVAEEISNAYLLSRRQSIEATREFNSMVMATAELYELSAKNSSIIVAGREGLVISDQAVHERSNQLVDKVNHFQVTTDSAFRRLDDPLQQARFIRMGVTRRIK